MERKKVPKKEAGEISRREFLRDAGFVVGGAAIGSTVLLAACGPGEVTTETVTTTTTETVSKFICPFCSEELVTLSALTSHVEAAHPAEVEVVPLSKAYLLIDPKKCTGCCSCMLACSLVHEGVSSLSLSRIQILDDAFGSFPTDIEVAMCRQCDNPECYLACPLQDEALCIDEETGVRYIDEEKCNGCKLCIEPCIFKPSRISFNVDKNVAVKCDMCQNTPYWDSQGKQACVEVCPTRAIKFTTAKPIGDSGYKVNLRGEGWAALDLPTD